MLIVRCIFALLLLAMFASYSWGQSRKEPPEQKTTNAQQQSAADQRGTEQSPAFVKIIPAQKSAEESEQDRKERADKSNTDWWLIKLTGALAIIGALQLVVFGIQARRLRQTVNAVNDQGSDMKKSVAESGRAAAAMEDVAKHIATSAHAATESVAAMKARTAQQMRAYVTVLINNGWYQERAKNVKFGVVPVITNSGQTPAHNLQFRAKAAIFPVPLPDNISLDIRADEPWLGGAVLGPHQTFTFTTLIDGDFLPDVEVPAIQLGTSRRLYIWGTVRYWDVFGEMRETDFSHSIYWILGDKPSVTGNYERRNTAT